MTDNLWLWIGFNAFILLMLALDLGVFHRKAHIVTFKESIAWTVAWITLALVFNLGVAHYMGHEKGLEFFTGYVIEKSLSVDNVFVIALLFSYFAVPTIHQHKVLFWGILGALAMRAIMIFLGAALINEFAWIIYVFGAFLILTGIKMIVKREEEIHPERNPLVRWFKKLMPVTNDYRGDRFFVRENSVRMATPLFVVLLLVEFSDLIFAVDSIPAIFAVTKDPFIVYTSNVFAILGLRSLYFALAGVLDKFHYLKIGLGVVLSFVGVKMLLAHSPWKIDTHISLGVIVVILAVSVVASLVWPKKPVKVNSGVSAENSPPTYPDMHETYDEPLLLNDHPATGPRLGIIGGGQLARMTTIAAQQLGCDVVVLENNRLSPAATFASRSIIGDWNTAEALLRLASQVDVVTLENEFVDAALLAELEQAGHSVWPGSRTISLVQDKFSQKQALQAAGLPIPRMRATGDLAELEAAVAEFGLPLVLKARRNAYDGKGNATIRTEADIKSAWEQLGGHHGNPLYVEEFCAFTAELATIITRGRNGETAIYPIVETVQRNHICHLVRAPAAVTPGIVERAADMARRAVEAVGAVGSFGVEMFLTTNDWIVINELAPRVHNSGHYTIEACECSQFENHVRAVLGLPLGSTRMVAPAAVMINLLGSVHAPGRIGGLHEALAVPGAHVHLYGKAMSGAGRKMGHVTALGNTPAEAEQAAIDCAAKIHFGKIL